MMNLKLNKVLIVFSLLTLPVVFDRAYAQDQKVSIVQPENNAVVRSPVKICMEIEGLILESDKDENGNNRENKEGYGHHHILFSSLPVDLEKPIGRKEAIHMNEGLPCRIVNLIPGKHVIRALFSYADHVPYNPPITDKILITVINDQ
ncbi:MAG: DUF4399 domain-containing protein [Nitrospinae bacterium]|nr:DUF4399 domain-containing protein [Nitrospinota bacterium]